MRTPLRIALALTAACATGTMRNDNSTKTSAAQESAGEKSDGGTAGAGTAGTAAATSAASTAPKPPPTRRATVTDQVHGVAISDDYRWLEDEKSPEVQAWMQAQQDFTRAQLDALPDRAAIVKRLTELYYFDSMGPPEHRGDKLFFTRRSATQEKAQVIVREGAKERVLLDPQSWTKDGSDALGNWRPSWDGKRVAFNVRHHNSDESTLYVLDTATLQRSAVDVIPGTKYGGASWTPKGDGFYYTWIPAPDPKVPASDRPGLATVKFHKLGEDPAKDAVILEPTRDPTTFQNVQLSKDGHWLVRELQHGWRSVDVWFRDARKGPKAPWTPLAVGQDAMYSVDVYRDHFYVLTNEGAPNSRLFAVDPLRPARAQWKEVVPERKDATLEHSTVVGGRLGLAFLRDAVSHLEVRELDGRAVRDVELPALGTAYNLVGDEDDDEAYFVFESFVFPREIHKTSVKNGGSELYFRVKIPADPSPFVVEQQFTQSKDGTKVPVFIVHRKDLKLDGSAPTVLNGYGGFLVANTPTFQPGFFPWLEKGGVYALAILRGGGEYGEEWHRKGMLGNKQNVFDDFIAAAEHLIKGGYTRPDRLAILGGSNGGLLVGAAEVQRPDLFGVVFCHVPLLDMVRYHLYGSGKTWISEYGTAEDKAQFEFLRAYSPYQQIKAGTRYPATLVFSADSDDRVDPMHARKFSAALQAATTGGPVLLRIEKNAGHGGADLIRATVEKTADEYVFAIANLHAPMSFK